MKKNCFYLMSIALSSILSFVSCDNSIETEIQQKASIENVNIENSSEASMLKFIYKGVLYTSERKIEGDSSIILDENVRRVAEQMALLPELSGHMNRDGIIEYFDNIDIAEAYLGNPIIGMATRETLSDGLFEITGATATLWDDEGYSDRSFPFTITESMKGDSVYVRDFKNNPYGFNDKASSLKVISNSKNVGIYGQKAAFVRIGLIVFEDKNYGGYSHCFDVVNYTTTLGPLHIDNLVRSLKAFDLYPNSSRNWNDKISSIKLKYLGRDGNY